MKIKAAAFDSKWFCNNEKNQLLAARFFYTSSYITAFFLFSRVSQITVSLFAATSFYFSSYYFRTLVAIFADINFNVPFF